MNVGADATITPGGGTLDWKLGYFGNFAFFDASGTNAPFNNLQNTIFTRGQWKFGPKTAVIYDGNFAFVNYQQQDQAFNGLLDSDAPSHRKLGLSGLIGSRFGLTAFAGYGGSFVNTGGNAPWSKQVQQYDSVIGQLEAKFFLTANPAADNNPGAVTLAISSLSVGYNRDFSQSYLGSFYGSDRGYLKFAFFFGGRALVSLEGGAGARVNTRASSAKNAAERWFRQWPHEAVHRRSHRRHAVRRVPIQQHAGPQHDVEVHRGNQQHQPPCRQHRRSVPHGLPSL